MGGGATGVGTEAERAAEGIAHLQAAAREMIAAARVLLDVAEDLVDDPGTVTAVVDAVGSVVRTAARAGRDAVARPAAPGSDDGGVQHIRVG